ncbi:MAG: UDP-N-acetylmuramate dehydrogenase [Roseburia sp.]|nr:UDP-N-acetylmuramate dehydrogenase [Roseburia sp.]
MNNQLLEQLEQIVGKDSVRLAEPMSRHTTFRVGGPADVLVTPDRSALAQVVALCKKEQTPYCIIGNGSNLLVGDGGIRGVVIETKGALNTLRADGERIVAGAGALLSQAASRAASQGLSGMEFAAGIPGTVGGAVVMNAGAYGGEMKDIIESVTVLDQECREKVLSVEELELGYRSSSILKNGYIVLEAVFHLAAGDAAQIKARMQELAGQRMAKQPLEYPSAGSTFKRPEGYFAGKLIMDAGLRGYQVGGAQVAEKHCGFVINRGGATAADIVKLMEDVKCEVERQFHVTLEPEVKMLGEF